MLYMEERNNAPMERTAAEIRPNAQTQALIGRQGQEVQAAVFMAKQFPRDISRSMNNVIMSCRRKALAEAAVYEYPRGGTKVTGASIRLAEAIAQAWGNIDTGVIELERRDGESSAMAYAWDLETNYRQTKTFTVKHVRETKRGSQVLTDTRDIYELIANQGARRQRACILGVIPGDVVDTALAECEKTLQRGDKPLSERIQDMAQAFYQQYGVTVDMLEQNIGMNISAFTEQAFIKLSRIYTSLRDGMAKVEDYFDTSLGTKQIQSEPEKLPEGFKPLDVDEDGVIEGSSQLDMDALAEALNQAESDEI